MSKDSARLSRLGVLAPAALSACMDASVLAVPAAGAIVSTVLKELSKAFMLKKWFHGVMSAKEAESLMMERGRNGSFLVRESQTHPGEYVLSVRVRGRVSHVMIRKQHEKYNVGSGEHFEDLVGLIEHFRSYPIIETSGEVLRLLQPVSGTFLRANNFEHKRQEMGCKAKICSPQYLKEFNRLFAIENEQGFTTDAALKSDNLHKNRYKVYPYDQTRVILHNDGDKNKSDYINASYIHEKWTKDLINPRNSSDDSDTSSNSEQESKKKKIFVSKIPKASFPREVMSIKMSKANTVLCRDITKDKIYIAAQGCLPNTINDFWRMIWENDVRVIVMLTNEVEKKMEKCSRYWPMVNEEISFDDLNVQSLSETTKNDYIIREFEVKSKNIERNVYQYHFKAWLDHKIPDNIDNVLQFLGDVNRRIYHIAQSMEAPDNNMICVHCAAGVGRTGAYIALDILLDRIKISGFNCEIDVFDIVRVMRIQRAGMVRNISQYKFIHEVAQKYIDNNVLKKVHKSSEV